MARFQMLWELKKKSRGGVVGKHGLGEDEASAEPWRLSRIWIGREEKVGIIINVRVRYTEGVLSKREGNKEGQDETKATECCWNVKLVRCD